MKKFLFFIVLVVAGYFVYDNFIKEKEVVKITASYSKAREAVDVNTPSLSPRDFAHYEGTVKNISENPLYNLTITYLIDAQVSDCNIDKLNPGEEKNFKTKSVMLRHIDPGHYLKEVTYDKE